MASADQDSREGNRRDSLTQFSPGARLTIERYLQDLANADTPPVTIAPKYHTGKIPNSKSRDGKPRLLLMGQRRYVSCDTTQANIAYQS
jgi:hypothetical protein